MGRTNQKGIVGLALAALSFALVTAGIWGRHLAKPGDRSRTYSSSQSAAVQSSHKFELLACAESPSASSGGNSQADTVLRPQINVTIPNAGLSFHKVGGPWPCEQWVPVATSGGGLKVTGESLNHVTFTASNGQLQTSGLRNGKWNWGDVPKTVTVAG